MIDFTHDDDDDNLPADPQFDVWIERAAPSLNAPPVTPRADMWAAIEAKQAASAQPVAGIVPLRRTRWVIPTSIAAALLLGIAIDRVAVRPAVSPQRTAPAAQVAAAVPSPGAPYAANEVSRLYRLAAVQTLTQAEALLTAYRASGVAARDPKAAKQLGAWGREVLSSTRLLIDSPAGNDPALRSLFNDLELVLVQIIRLSGAPLDTNERALIDDALRNRDLLPRIRTAVPAGVAGAASGD